MQLRTAVSSDLFAKIWRPNQNLPERNSMSFLYLTFLNAAVSVVINNLITDIALVLLWMQYRQILDPLPDDLVISMWAIINLKVVYVAWYRYLSLCTFKSLLFTIFLLLNYVFQIMCYNIFYYALCKFLGYCINFTIIGRIIISMHIDCIKHPWEAALLGCILICSGSNYKC